MRIIANIKPEVNIVNQIRLKLRKTEKIIRRRNRIPKDWYNRQRAVEEGQN